jgi:hypothetical protein
MRARERARVVRVSSAGGPSHGGLMLCVKIDPLGQSDTVVRTGDCHRAMAAARFNHFFEDNAMRRPRRRRGRCGLEVGWRTGSLSLSMSLQRMAGGPGASSMGSGSGAISEIPHKSYILQCFSSLNR